MSKAAKFLSEDGIEVNTKDLYLIAINQKTIESLYIVEAQERMRLAPAYKKDAEIGIAKERAVRCPKISHVDPISVFRAEDFSINAGTFQVKINADIEKSIRERHTRKLTHGQLELISLVENYRDAGQRLNEALLKLNQHPAKIESPYLFNSGTVDIETVAYRVKL